jgi:PII-like signaling protein
MDTSNDIEGRGLCVRAYFGECDRRGHQSLWSALLQTPRREGAAGATVTWAITGFGAHSKIHAASIVDLSSDLPLILEWVDTEERVTALLPRIEAMLEGGLVAIEPVTIVRYRPHRDRGGD